MQTSAIGRYDPLRDASSVPDTGRVGSCCGKVKPRRFHPLSRRPYPHKEGVIHGPQAIAACNAMREEPVADHPEGRDPLRVCH